MNWLNFSHWLHFDPVWTINRQLVFSPPPLPSPFSVLDFLCSFSRDIISAADLLKWSCWNVLKAGCRGKKRRGGEEEEESGKEENWLSNYLRAFGAEDLFSVYSNSLIYLLSIFAFLCLDLLSFPLWSYLLSLHHYFIANLLKWVFHSGLSVHICQ